MEPMKNLDAAQSISQQLPASFGGFASTEVSSQGRIVDSVIKVIAAASGDGESSLRYAPRASIPKQKAAPSPPPEHSFIAPGGIALMEDGTEGVEEPLDPSFIGPPPLA